MPARTAEDVRRDPQPGDEARKDGTHAWVESVPSKPCEEWRKWAKDAEVIHIAGGAE